MSGIETSSFIFLGFPPSRSKDKEKWFSALADEKRTLIIFEAPHRILLTLRSIYKNFGNRTISLCREMTKKHEESVIRPIKSIIDDFEEPKGEYTVVITGNTDTKKPIKIANTEEIWNEFGRMTEKKIDFSQGSNKIACRSLFN